MALSNMTIVSDGDLEFVSISFNYLDRSEISVYFDSVPTNTWAWVGDTNQIKFTPKVPNGVTVLIARMTDASDLRHIFSEGAAFTAKTLDEDLRQVLHIVQEAKETNLSGDFYSDIDMHGFQINNLGTATLDNQAVSLGQYRADVLGAGVARDEAEGYRDQTLSYRNEAEGFKNTAQSSATTATTQAGTATTQAGNASISASDALSYRNTALTYRNEAEGFRNDAEDFKDDAEQAVIDAANASRLTVGTVTTGSPGSSASVNISGSAGSQVLDLTIPRGDKGEPGDVQSGGTPVVGQIAVVSATSPTTITSGTTDEGVFGIGANGSTTALGGSFNVTSGAGVFYAGSNPTGNPGGTNPILWHRAAGTNGAQVVVNDAGEAFFRGRASSTWGSWRRAWTNTDFGIYIGGSAPSSSDVMAASPANIELNYTGSGNRNAYIDFHSRDGTDYDARIIKHSGADGDLQILTNNGSVSNEMTFSATAQAIFFNRSGSLGGSITTNPSIAVSWLGLYHGSSATGQWYVAFYRAGSAIGSIAVASASSVSFNTASDYRLKEQVRPLEGALDRIMAAKPVTYKWKSDGSDGEGFLAHELAEVVPLAVTGEKDAVDEDGKPKHQQVDYSRVVPLLTKGIQELILSVQSLQSTIKELEDRITDLENSL